MVIHHSSAQRGAAWLKREGDNGRVAARNRDILLTVPESLIRAEQSSRPAPGTVYGSKAHPERRFARQSRRTQTRRNDPDEAKSNAPFRTRANAALAGV